MAVAEAASVDKPTDFGTDEAATALRWISELDRSEKAQANWIKRGGNIVRRYENERTEIDLDSKKRQFALLWANIQTLAPAVYARTPTAVVGRRWKDGDPIARSASEVIERALNFQLDAMDFEDIMTSMRDEYLLVARAQAWVRYVPHMGKAPIAAPANDESPGAQDNAPTEPPDGEVTDNQSEYDVVLWEEVVADHVHWTDFGTNPARTWSEVRFVWRRAFMTREELVARFGDRGKDCPLDWKYEEGGESEQADEQFHKAAVYEIWDKVGRKAIWINRAQPSYPLDERDDPLGLPGFFPCPRPLLGTCGPNSIIPTPDYNYYESQANQINELTRRIGLMTDALRVRGFYAAMDGENLNNLLDSDTNTLIPIASWAALMEKGGLEKMISWFPVEVVAQTLKSCIDARQQLLQDVFQITGIADIMRGDTDPDETLGAQKLKATWGSSRVRDKQKELARFVKDLLRIMGQVVATKFSTDTLAQMTGVQMLQSVAQKQGIQAQQQMQAQLAQQAAAQPRAPGQPAPPTPPAPDPKLVRMLADPTWEEVEAMLRDNAMRSFRIDIETDSTIEPNDQDEKQRRVEFVEAVGQYLEKTMTVVQLAPQMLPVVIEGLKFLVRGFRVGREMEDVIEQSLDALQAAAEQKQANPQPNPEAQVAQAKAQADGMRAQADGVKAQAAMVGAQAGQVNAQADMIRAHNDVAKAQTSAQVDAAALQSDNHNAQADRQSTEAMHGADLHADLQKSVIAAIQKHFVRDVNNDRPMQVPTP